MSADLTKPENDSHQFLAQGNKRLLDILEASGLGTWEWNVQTGAARFNERWAKNIGTSLPLLQPVSIDTWWERAHPDDLLRSQEQLKQHFAGTLARYECEMRMRHPDGHWIWVLNSGAVTTRTSDGQPEWMCGTQSDITARKQKEQMRLQREELLHFACSLANIGGWEVTSSREVMWSAETRRIHRVDSSYQPTLTAAFDFYPPEARPVIIDAVEKALVPGGGFDLELPLIRADDERIWVRVIGNAQKEDDNSVRLVGAVQDITDRIHSQIARQEINARLTLATDSGGIGIWEWDIATDILIWDHWMYRLYGMKPPLPGHSEKVELWSRHLHPDDRAKTEQAFRDGIEGIRPYQVEFRIVWADGSVHYLRGSGNVVRDERGRPLRIVGANWNVTGLHRLATELSEQRELLEVTLRSIGDGVITTDPEGRVLLLNPVAEDLTGWTTAEAVGRPLSEVFRLSGDQTIDKLLTTYQTQGRNGGSHSSTLLRARNGREYSIEESAAPIRKAGGEILGVVLVFHDVSKQRQIQESLQESEQRFNAFMENSPALTFIKDREGRMVYMNPICRKMWNFDGVDWKGKSDAELWSPELADGFRKLDLSVLDSNTSGVNLDVVPLPDGTVCSLLSYKFPLALPSGERLVGGVSIDISEQKEAERRTVQALAEKEVLLKEVHHRVKNNLQVISSMLRMQSQCVQDTEAIAALEVGRQRVYSMALIHEQLYSNEQMSHLDLATYTKTLVEQLVRAYSRSGHVASLVNASTVLVDIEQAIPFGLITNELVTNALKYAYPEESQGLVTVSLSGSAAGQVRLTVADTGVGLPPEFDWKSSKSMGLTIVDILAKQLGGTWSFARKQPGAEFTVEFQNERSSG